MYNTHGTILKIYIVLVGCFVLVPTGIIICFDYIPLLVNITSLELQIAFPYCKYRFILWLVSYIQRVSDFL